MSCSSGANKNTIIDPLFSERTSLRLTQEKMAGAMLGTVRAQQMNDPTLHSFLLRRNNQAQPVIYNDIIQRRSSPGACFKEGNVFTLTDIVSQYVLKDDNGVIRTGSYYIPTNVIDDNGFIGSDTPILFFFRGESKTEDLNLSRDIHYFNDVYVNEDTDKILISMHPLKSNDLSYNYNIFDDTAGISNDRLGNEDDIVSFEYIRDKAREIIGLDSSSPLYARGHSDGGNFCYRLAKENLVDGIIVSGANYIYDNLEFPTVGSTTAIDFVFIIHGENDTLVPYDICNNDLSYNSLPASLGIQYYDTITSSSAWLNILRNNSSNEEHITNEINELKLINIGTDININNLEIVNFNPTDINFRLWKITNGTHNIPKNVEIEIMNELNTLY